MTAPSKVARASHAGVSPARTHKPRKFPVSDGAPVEVVEDGPSIAGRLTALAALLTIRPTLAIGSYAPRLPWPWGLVDFVARVMRPAPGTVRATISLPNCTAQLVRAGGVLPADGNRSVVLRAAIPLTCPVRLLHGMADESVPWRQSLKLAERLDGRDVALTLVKDGDHRLSRDEDLARLARVLDDLSD